MGASSNFGNMFSVLGASIFLPFLPMAPIQVLTNNLLYDFCQTAIPTDNVDEEYIASPRRWDIDNIFKFMIFIGPISSIFDYATYGMMLFGWKRNPHFGPFHILSFVLIGGGFGLIAAAWRVLFDAQQRHTLAITGPYNHIRHPQYVGFILVMLGFLVQWPTLLTLAMFPVLVWMYVRLAHQEERDVRAEFGEAYDRYAASTPAGFPRLGGAGTARSSRA